MAVAGGIEHNPLACMVHVQQKITFRPVNLLLVGGSRVDPSCARVGQIFSDHSGKVAFIWHLERGGGRHLMGETRGQVGGECWPKLLRVDLAAFDVSSLAGDRGAVCGQVKRSYGQSTDLAGAHAGLERKAVQNRAFVAGQSVAHRSRGRCADQLAHLIDGKRPAAIRLDFGIVDLRQIIHRQSGRKLLVLHPLAKCLHGDDVVIDRLPADLFVRSAVSEPYHNLGGRARCDQVAVEREMSARKDVPYTLDGFFGMVERFATGEDRMQKSRLDNFALGVLPAFKVFDEWALCGKAGGVDHVHLFYAFADLLRQSVLPLAQLIRQACAALLALDQLHQLLTAGHAPALIGISCKALSAIQVVAKPNVVNLGLMVPIRWFE